MKAIAKLDIGINSYLNNVLITFLEIGEGKSDGGKTKFAKSGGVVIDLTQSQRETCTLVAGVLTAAKVSIMQAGEIMNEIELGHNDS